MIYMLRSLLEQEVAVIRNKEKENMVTKKQAEESGLKR